MPMVDYAPAFRIDITQDGIYVSLTGKDILQRIPAYNKEVDEAVTLDYVNGELVGVEIAVKVDG